jgi:hypothetical protein
MDSEIFAVYDSKAAYFMQPFFSRNAETALRMFREIIQDPQTQVHKFPEDYTLFHIGTYSAADGMIIPQEPRSLGVAITLLPPQPGSTEPVLIQEPVSA